jgi:hypothetical protein
MTAALLTFAYMIGEVAALLAFERFVMVGIRVECQNELVPLGFLVGIFWPVVALFGLLIVAPYALFAKVRSV